MTAARFTIGKEESILLPDRALYLTRLKTLIITDLHLGKINHFRKAGIAVPPAANKANTELLIRLIMERAPERVIFIGDLFHSYYNTEWEVLGQVIRHFSNCSFELVPGNHDILGETQYRKHHIKLHPLQYKLTPRITLTHEPAEVPVEGHYYLSGHIHPAVTLHGRGRQSLTFPCFWFSKHQAFIPAFGVFTGFKSIRAMEGDTIFGIIDGKVVELGSPAT